MSDRLAELREHAIARTTFKADLIQWAADEIDRLRAAITEALEELDNCGHCTCGYVAAGRHLLTDALKGTTDDR